MNQDLHDRTDDPFRILFVCTGNTCRSPMAEGIARHELAERGWDRVEVASAGVAAFPGSPISAGAVRAARAHGISLEDHRSSPLTLEALGEASLILAMSPGHLAPIGSAGFGERAALITAFADGAREPRPDDDGVRDPIGGDDALYEATFRELQELVRRAMDRLEPLLVAEV